MKWPGRDVRLSDWRTAIALALVTVLFGALIQVESFALYARGGGAGADAAFLLALPFLQLDSLLIGALLGAGHLVLARTRLRWGALAVAVLVNAWVIVNQAGYGAVRQNLSVFDPDIALARVFADAPKLLSSVPASGAWLAVFNAIVLGASAEWVRRRVQSAPIDAELKWPLVTPARVVMATLWLVSSFLAPRVVDTHGLDRHAIVAALTPATIHFDANLAAGDSAFLRSPFDTSSADASDARLADIVSRARALHRPNVLLVVLESVGTEQLFPGGQADSTLTPTIARLARGGVLFPDVYSVSVSTTRAHLPMMTGGPVVTWGDANDLFKGAFVGPSLPGELRKMSYRTGLFAATDLGFAQLDRFYRGLPWDTLLHFGDGHGPLDASQKVSYWGVNEDYLWTHARRWIGSAGPRAGKGGERAPFFLNFQTISTHDPYGTPSGYSGPFKGTDVRSKYFNSLAYTDAALGRVLADIKASGELERTIVVITGDHGEAFGDKHLQNLAHRNYLFEENVRSFLLFWIPGTRAPVVSRRVGTHADLMPSLLALLPGGGGGAGTATPGGQNLFASTLAPRPAYFNKVVPPAQWGLRDGQWKFIDRIAGGAAELYDLEHDADEHVNLASQHPDMVATYNAMAQAWFGRSSYDFISHMKDSVVADTEVVGRGGAVRQGFRDVRVGWVPVGEPSKFTESASVARDAKPAIAVRWYSLDGDAPIRVRVVSPSHRFWVSPLTIDGAWSSTVIQVPLTDKESGRWTVDVWSATRRLGRTEFVVP